MKEESSELNVKNEANKVIKGFRHTPDVENFYRFVNENGLRKEAKLLLEKIYTIIKKQKKSSRKSKTVH